MTPELIEKAKKDPQAFGQLYDILYPEVYKFIFFRVSRIEIAEDLLSAIWEKVLLNLHTFQSNHPTVFKVWIFRIARNTLYEQYRKSPKEDYVPLENFDIPDETSVDGDLKIEEQQKYLQQLLRHLPPLESEIICLRYFSDLKNKEIANILNISEKMVAAYLSRALKNLRTYL